MHGCTQVTPICNRMEVLSEKAAAREAVLYGELALYNIYIYTFIYITSCTSVIHALL